MYTDFMLQLVGIKNLSRVFCYLGALGVSNLLYLNIDVRKVCLEKVLYISV